MRNLESLGSGSYMCVGELLLPPMTLNASSETTIMVASNNSPKQNKLKSFSSYKGRAKPHQDNDLTDDYLSDARSSSDEDNDLDSDLFNDEIPALNPTMVDQIDDKGFCEPYRGSVCAGMKRLNKTKQKSIYF
jgi:hypothetical protein